MSSCLGIYIGDKVVKYAKLATEENSSKIKAVAYGTRIHPGNKSDIINNIVAATGSDDVAVCVNSENDLVHKVEVLRRINKSDLESLIDLEVIDFTGNEDKTERSFTYRYTLLDSSISKDNYSANIIVQEKAAIEKYLADEENKVVSIYPMPYVMDEIVTKEASNYLIINMNDETELTFVNDGKLANVTKMELGMKKIFDVFPEMLGSFQKAYDVCKTINVFSDDSNVNNPELENIIEPVLQDALNRIQLKIKEVNLRVDRIYLCGAITLFINSDMLFEQYFEIPTEKLRPYFVDAEDSSYNLSEVTESAEAFALAYEGLMVERPELDFIRQQKKFNLSFSKPVANKYSGAKVISNKKKKNNNKLNRVNNNNLRLGSVSLDKIRPIVIVANVVMATVLIMYCAFGAIYNTQLNTQIAAIQEESAKVQQSTQTVNADISYINQNTTKYTNYTSYIDETLRKIKNGEIGKYSTYNVALFMLKVSKYIPEDVTLESIKSDSNKHVTIVAKSNTHVGLGYLVSQLKLQGILEPSSVQTTAVVHDDVITVTIGGDLP